jgi:nucleotide-binding universal stress UspA family protein
MMTTRQSRPKRVAAFTHILIPADDDPGSRRAFEPGVELAKRFGARITGFHAMTREAKWISLTEQLEHPSQEVFTGAQARARKVFAPLKRLCKQSGVRCETVSEPAENPAEAIVTAAKKLKCDLIVMASRGRIGVARLVLGSQTRNVLDHGDLPVLVVR